MALHDARDKTAAFTEFDPSRMATLPYRIREGLPVIQPESGPDLVQRREHNRPISSTTNVVGSIGLTPIRASRTIPQHLCPPLTESCNRLLKMIPNIRCVASSSLAQGVAAATCCAYSATTLHCAAKQ